jgi:hypothetical protein
MTSRIDRQSRFNPYVFLQRWAAELIRFEASGRTAAEAWRRSNQLRLFESIDGLQSIDTYFLETKACTQSAVKNPISDGFELGG